VTGHRAYIGLGSNLLSPEMQLLTAFDEIAATPGITRVACSSLYRTAPVGFDDQPHFVNAVAEVRTELTPPELLRELLAIERVHGRVREFLNAPRTLDLDILLYDDSRFETDGLVIPHPRAHLRAFVLLPLLELAPDCHIPGAGPAREWLARCGGQGIVRIGEQITLRIALGHLAGSP
jgi:2-amino-4-hydroxy-6-hydroxymethyldihydropteridine diphosphokinase